MTNRVINEISDLGKFLLNIVAAVLYIGTQFFILHFIWLKSMKMAADIDANMAGYALLSFLLCIPGMLAISSVSITMLSRTAIAKNKKFSSQALAYVICLAISTAAVVLLYLVPLGVDFLLRLTPLPPNLIAGIHLLIVFFIISELLELPKKTTGKDPGISALTPCEIEHLGGDPYSAAESLARIKSVLF